MNVRFQEPEFQRTYIALDTDGTIREQPYRGTEAYLDIVEDIASGQYEAASVFKLHNAFISDVTEAVVDEVYSRVINSPSSFIPGFLKEHLDRESYNVLLASKQTVAERRGERAENAADRARSERVAA